MRLSARVVNEKGVKFSRSKLVSAYDGYVRQYMKSCALLWDLGYITNPSYFDIAGFVEAIGGMENSQLFTHELSGQLDFSPLRCDYVLDFADISDDFRVALKLLKSAMESSQALNDFAALCKTVKIPKRSDEFIAKVYLAVSTHVYNSGKAPLDSPYIHNLVDIGVDRELEHISYAEIVLRELCKKVGMSPEKIAKYKEHNKSIFLGGSATFSDDIKYLSLFEGGNLKCGTKYGEKLLSIISDYYKESYSQKVNCIPFWQQNFVDCTEECVKFMNKIREDVLPKGYKEEYVCGYEVIYSKPKENSDNSKSKSLFVGLPVFDHYSGTRLSAVNQLNGLSGEISSEDEAALHEGFPIELEGYNKRCWYPLCMSKVHGEPMKPTISWGSYEGFMFRDLDAELKRMRVNNIDEMMGELSDALSDNQFNGRHVGNIIAELVKTLICIECDVTLHGRTSPNQAVFSEDISDLTAEGWQYIFRETSAIFNSLMFN